MKKVKPAEEYIAKDPRQGFTLTKVNDVKFTVLGQQAESMAQGRLPLRNHRQRVGKINAVKSALAESSNGIERGCISTGNAHAFVESQAAHSAKCRFQHLLRYVDAKQFRIPIALCSTD